MRVCWVQIEGDAFDQVLPSAYIGGQEADALQGLQLCDEEVRTLKSLKSIILFSLLFELVLKLLNFFGVSVLSVMIDSLGCIQLIPNLMF